MQPPTSKDFTITGNLVINGSSTSLGDFYAKSKVVISNPITIDYQPTTINNAVGNQIGAQQIGQYHEFTVTTPTPSINISSINLQPGMWLVESSISYQTDGPMTNTEYLSLSYENSSISTSVLITTPIISNKAFARHHRISNLFSINETQTIYTVFYAADYDGTINNISFVAGGQIKATRIA